MEAPRLFPPSAYSSRRVSAFSNRNARKIDVAELSAVQSTVVILGTILRNLTIFFPKVELLRLETCEKDRHLIDLVKSFATSFFSEIGVYTVESEPLKAHEFSSYGIQFSLPPPRPVAAHCRRQRRRQRGRGGRGRGARKIRGRGKRRRGLAGASTAWGTHDSILIVSLLLRIFFFPIFHDF